MEVFELPEIFEDTTMKLKKLLLSGRIPVQDRKLRLKNNFEYGL